MTRVLCVGEPLISLTPMPGTRLVDSDEVHLGVGGAELNVAVHLARLGLEVAYAGAVGRDAFGARLRELLTREGVDCAELSEADGPTGVYFKDADRMLYYRAGSAGSRRGPVVVPPGTDLVHLTGVSLAVAGELARSVAVLLGSPRTCRVSFDVNYRPALWSRESAGPLLLEAARAADLVLVGRDEALAVWGTGDRDQILALLSHDHELVLKDGPGDVEVWAEGRWHRSTPPPAEIAEVVGAGDAFAAAYLSSRLAGRDPTSSAEAGHRLAAHVMSSVADQGAADPEVYGAVHGHDERGGAPDRT